VCERDGPDDRQTQPEALVLVADGAATEALEDLVAVPGGHTRAGVPHPQPSGVAVVRRAQRDLVTGSGVLDGVVAELQQGLGQPLLVDLRGHARRLVERPAPLAEAARLGEDVDGEPGEVHRSAGDEVRAVALGQEDEVADQASHPVHLVQQELPGLGDLLGTADVQQLEVAAQHRQRRLELVPRVVEELPLPDERLLEPVEHPVDGAGERGDVVVAGHRQAPGEVGVGDLVGGLAQGAQRRQQPAGLPGGEGDHEQQ
jgi:hypothetical protein